MSEHITEKQLTLLQIAGLTDIKTGEYVLRLDFGELIQNNPDITSRLSPDSNPSGQKEVEAATAVFFLKPEHVGPFRVGLKYKLSVAEDGKIELTPE